MSGIYGWMRWVHGWDGCMDGMDGWVGWMEGWDLWMDEMGAWMGWVHGWAKLKPFLAFPNGPWPPPRSDPQATP